MRFRNSGPSRQPVYQRYIDDLADEVATMTAELNVAIVALSHAFERDGQDNPITLAQSVITGNVLDKLQDELVPHMLSLSVLIERCHRLIRIRESQSARMRGIDTASKGVLR